MLLSIVLFLACGAEKPTNSASGSTATQQPENNAEIIDPITTFFIGTANYTFPDHENWGTSTEDIAIRKTIDPATLSLTEEIHLLGFEGYRMTTIHCQISDTQFSGEWEDESGILQIEGEFLAGAEWAWTKWTSTSTYSNTPPCDNDDFCIEDGDYFISMDNLQDNILVVDKNLYKLTTGNIYMKATETLMITDEASFQSKVAEMQE